MNKTQKTAKRAVKAKSPESEAVLAPVAQKLQLKFDAQKVKRYGFAVLTLISVAFLGYWFKDRYLAGMVNNSPIFRTQLNSRLSQQYGKQVLEDLVVEKLIEQEAKKNGVVVSAKEIEAEIDVIKAQLGDQTDLDSVLAFQGLKKSDLERQLRIQLILKKLLEKDIAVSEEEIASYIKENKKVMTATSEAELNTEARERLTEQKFAEKINPWISDLLTSAKVVRFLR